MVIKFSSERYYKFGWRISNIWSLWLYRQRKFLSSSEKIINKHKQQLKKLEELVKARFVEMFGNPTDGNFKRVPLSEYVESTKYGTSRPPQFDVEGDFKIIRATNIKNGRIIEKDMLRITKDEAEKISKCKLNGGEMIIVRIRLLNGK